VPQQEVETSFARITRALKVRDYQAKFLFCLGDIYDHMNNRERAMELYKEGLTLLPSYARAYLRLGEDLEYYRRYDEALSNYKKAHALSKDDPEIASRLSRLESRMQNRQNDLAWRLRDVFLSALMGREGGYSPPSGNQQTP
jgi:tetratricopeptide (TPR) repeat protein